MSKQAKRAIWQWLRERPWVLIIALAALLPLTWFAGAYLVTGTDINFPLDPLYRLTSRFQLWDQSFITGRDQSVALPTQVFAGVQALLSLLGFGNTVVEQLELVFWLGVSGLAVTFFLAQLLHSQKPEARKWGMTLGVTVYLFNLFLVNRINEIDVATLGAYVLIPALLGFGLSVAGGRLPPWKAGMGAALVSVLGVGLFANPPLVFVVSLFLAAFTIVMLLVHPKATSLNYLRFLIIFGLSFVAVHLWWLIPYIGSLNVLVGGEAGLGGLNLLDWVDGVSRDTNLWNVVRMQGAWDWYDTGIDDKPYFPPALIYQGSLLVLLLSLILPLGAALSWKALAKLDRPHRVLWWLAAVTLLVSLVYSMGTNNVVSRWIYDTSSNLIPFFWLVRSPWYKFGYLTVLGYTVLLTFLGAWLAQRARDTRYEIRDTKRVSRQSRLSYWIYRWSVPLLVLGVIAYAFPLLVGSTQLFPYTRLANGVPDYVTETTDYLNAQPSTHRVVTLPQEDAYNYTWGYGSGGDVLGHFLRRPVLSNETFAGGKRQGSDALLAAFYRSLYDSLPGEMSLLLDYLDGQWLIHKNDAKYADYGDTDSPDFIRDRLKLHPEIVLDRSIGQWDLYRRTAEAPGRILTSTKLWTFFGPPAGYLDELPYYLEHLSSEDELTQFYIRDLDETAGPGTTRSLVKVEMPRVENETLIEKIDFDAPFDGPITVERIVGSASGTLSLNGTRVTDGSQAQLQRTGNVFAVTSERLPDVITNPSFTDEVELGFPGPGPWNFSDSSKTAPGDAKFAIRRVPGSDESPGIELEASNHVLALHQWVNDFENLAIYRLSFDYRHVKGQAPSYATWQATSAVDEPNGILPKSNEWQRFETYVQTDIRSTGLLIYLYAGAVLDETTINQYDNVRVEKVGTRTTFAFFSLEAEAAPPPVITFAQASPTAWTATVEPTQSNYLLTFLESFNPGWVAEINDQRVAEDRHVKINGYANAWWLDPHPEPVEITLRYTPQDRFTLIGWISLLSILALIGLLIADWKRKRSQ